MDGYSHTGNQLSRSWTSIAENVQDGGQVDVGEKTRLRGLIIWFGGLYAKHKKYPRLRKFFFLRKTTTKFTLPARPIVPPFWRTHRADADRNIVSNFNKKMRGDRI